MSEKVLADFSTTPTIFMPFGLLRDRNLNGGEKLCYGALVHFAQLATYAFPSYGQVANLMGVSKEQVRLYLHKLVENKYIRVKNRVLKDGRNVYFFTYHENFRNPSMWRKRIKKNYYYFAPLRFLYGAFLPVCTLQDDNLSQGAKVCLARLIQYNWKTFRHIVVSVNDLAQECGVTTTQIKAYLQNLKETKYIEIHRRYETIYYDINQAILFGRMPSKAPKRKTKQQFTTKKTKK